MPDANSSIVVLNQPFASSAALPQTLPSEGVLEALKMIFTDAPLNDVLHSVALLIEAQTKEMLCTIFLLDEDGIRLRYAAGPSLPDAYRVATDGVPIGPEVGSCGAAAFLRKPVFVADVLTHPHFASFRDLLVEVGLRAAWSSPIMSHDDKVLGTFGMYNREVRHPSEAEMQLIDRASRIAGIAIERHRAQEKLRESERELRQITDVVPQALGVLDPRGGVLYANQATLDYTGFRAEDVLQPDFRERIFHPEDLERLRHERKTALEDGLPFEFEQRALRKDGQYRWFLIRYNPFRDEHGRVVRWYVAGTDIEELKRTEEKLREDERELRRTTDAIPHEIVVQDPSGVPLWANQATLDYLGLTADDIVRPGFRERIFHPDDIARLREERQASLARGLPFEIEQRALNKNGQYRWFLIKYNPFRDEKGNLVRWYATGTDIDDRKRREERTQSENIALREEIIRSSMFEEIVGSSESLRRVVAEVTKVAPTDSTVLIQGETGTGKELIARAIHNRSRRASRAFIRVNCAAIPPALIASELFGHEKGSFTGALQRRLGRFESADGGTIFLDEIGELAMETQVALLRVLQEREFERVGGNQSIPVDVRVLAATNKDLSTAVSDGAFREDLFYRLNVFPIQVPPLRDRAGDIPLLVEYLVERYAQKAGKKIRYINKETLDRFQKYEWPGNVRELQNVVERAVILSEGEVFSVDATWLAPAPSKSRVSSVPLEADLAKREKAVIEQALREAKGVIGGPKGAAAKLGVPRQTLESKIRKLGIDRYRFKTS